ncbi:MAG: hypothetical protein M0C28_27965 [Candidatus Moduliflexus flocculans]|nr:hypothetical protein [Candidatus Moduliflexus flocculans]
MTNEGPRRHPVRHREEVDRTEALRRGPDPRRPARSPTTSSPEDPRRDGHASSRALAKERGLDLVLDAMSSGVVTASPTIDITDEVVRRYDQSKAATPSVKK